MRVRSVLVLVQQLRLQAFACSPTAAALTMAQSVPWSWEKLRTKEGSDLCLHFEATIRLLLGNPVLLESLREIEQWTKAEFEENATGLIYFTAKELGMKGEGRWRCRGYWRYAFLFQLISRLSIAYGDPVHEALGRLERKYPGLTYRSYDSAENLSLKGDVIAVCLQTSALDGPSVLPEVAQQRRAFMQNVKNFMVAQERLDTLVCDSAFFNGPPHDDCRPSPDAVAKCITMFRYESHVHDEVQKADVKRQVMLLIQQLDYKGNFLSSQCSEAYPRPCSSRQGASSSSAGAEPPVDGPEPGLDDDGPTLRDG